MLRKTTPTKTKYKDLFPSTTRSASQIRRENRGNVEQGGRDLTVSVVGRAVGAGYLSPGLGRRESLQVGVVEPDGRRILPRHRLRCEGRRKNEAGAVQEGAWGRSRGECLLTWTDPEALGSSRAEYPPPDIIFAGDGSSYSGEGDVSRGGRAGGGCTLVTQAGRVNDEGWDGLCGISSLNRWIVPNRTHLTWRLARSVISGLWGVCLACG
jgi:hypothetical protein